MAAAGQSLGDRPPRRSLLRRLRRPHRELHRRGGPLPRALDPGERRSRACPTTRPCSATASTPATLLRLWKSEAVEVVRLPATSTSATTTARSRRRCVSETLSKVLYPNDEPESGSRLRLAQQYFFVSCSLQDMLRLLDLQRRARSRACRTSARCSSTTPTRRIAVAELMRLLVDEHALPWDEAWDITRAHARLHQPHPAAGGARDLAAAALRRACCRATSRSSTRSTAASSTRSARALPGDDGAGRAHVADRRGRREARAHGQPRHRRQPRGQRRGRAALRAAAADRAARLRRRSGPSASTTSPTASRPRRFLALSNPRLARLLDDTIGDGWVTDLDAASRASSRSPTTPPSRTAGARSSAPTRQALARRIRERTGIAVDPDALFDVQVKRIHEYKRQHLNVLHVVTLYNRLRREPAARRRAALRRSSAARRRPATSWPS